MKKIVIKISGMSCTHCEDTINKEFKKIKGIIKTETSFKKKESVIYYEFNEFPELEIKNKLQDIGYSYKGVIVEKPKKVSFKDVFPIISIMLILYLIVGSIFGFNLSTFLPNISRGTPLILLFGIGFLSSFHCIGMCGSINLAVCSMSENKTSIKNPLLYNLGRVVSYTVIGGIVGGLGSVLSINSTVQGIIILVASIFILMMALSMLGWLPEFLYKFLPRLPHLRNSNKRAPFIIGLLNGLMPCGPLQAMQLYALATGSVYIGALSMFLYALGTVPLMFGFGVLFTKLKGKYNVIIQRVSSILIIVLSLFMLNRVFVLWGIDLKNLIEFSISETDYSDYKFAEIRDGKQYVDIELTASGYTPIVVQKDIPVVFNIKVKNVDYYGCINSIKIPKFGIEKDFQNGDNIIEFTPTELGDITYTCWMGMVTSNIRVVEDLSKIKR